jgi:uncharacterized protein (TIGR00255 family)
MVLSMTGYGRAKAVLNGRDITFEIKSVNSRYFEYSSRLPRSCSFAEDALKKALSAKMGRGKAELHLSVQLIEECETEIKANLPVARGYYEALAEIARDLRINNGVEAADFVRLQDVFATRRAEADEDVYLADLLAVQAEAMEWFNQMRAAEGEKLAADVLARLDAIETMVGKVEKGSAGRAARYTEKLAERLKEILADTTIDEGRMLTEAVIFADKTAVDEETVRLRSHLAQFRQILAEGGQVGRKLDFLTQEINRETNTIGSKCQEVDITRLVVEMKAEIEKIREQIQNLE